MEPIQINTKLIAFCGLYCASCKAFKKGKCPGCSENSKASWCKIRTCNIENGYSNCTDCTQFSNPKDCSKYNNIFSKVIGFVTQTDRAKNIAMLKEKGAEAFVAFMSEKRWVSMKKK